MYTICELSAFKRFVKERLGCNSQYHVGYYAKPMLNADVIKSLRVLMIKYLMIVK